MFRIFGFFWKGVVKLPMIKKGALIVGIVIFIIGLGLTFIAYNQMYNPSPNATITVNGVVQHPGSSGYQTGAEIFFGITLIIALIGLFVSFTAIFKPNWIKSGRWGYSGYYGPPGSFRIGRQIQSSQNNINQPRNSQNFQQQQQPVDYSNIDNILGTAQTNREYSSTNTMNDTPQPSNAYSESYDSAPQPSDEYSNSFNAPTQSTVSDKSCPFCGSMVRNNEQFCNNCGKMM